MATKTEAQRAAETREFRAWYDEAHRAGEAAAAKRGAPEVSWVPTDIEGNRIGPAFSAPISGTAYIKVRPANHPFVRFLEREIGWHGFKGHYGGRQFSIRQFGQAFEPAMAYAEAFATAMREHGVTVYTDSWVN